jgi:hypothetical protein
MGGRLTASQGLTVTGKHALTWAAVGQQGAVAVFQGRAQFGGFGSGPDALPGVRANRAFLSRAVRYLAGEAGIRQFLDIGTGLPTADNTHEVAQPVAPGCRVVYVDNDPIVPAHGRALLDSTPEGATAYIEADARDTDLILREAAATLDFSQPVAVMALMVCTTSPTPTTRRTSSPG